MMLLLHDDEGQEVYLDPITDKICGICITPFEDGTSSTQVLTERYQYNVSETPMQVYNAWLNYFSQTSIKLN